MCIWVKRTGMDIMKNSVTYFQPKLKKIILVHYFVYKSHYFVIKKSAVYSRVQWCRSCRSHSPCRPRLARSRWGSTSTRSVDSRSLRPYIACSMSYIGLEVSWPEDGGDLGPESRQFCYTVFRIVGLRTETSYQNLRLSCQALLGGQEGCQGWDNRLRLLKGTYGNMWIKF